LLGETKQDNFDTAWGQCLAEMIAVQKLNENTLAKYYQRLTEI
jgi:hypothetical protein